MNSIFIYFIIMGFLWLFFDDIKVATLNLKKKLKKNKEIEPYVETNYIDGNSYEISHDYGIYTATSLLDPEIVGVGNSPGEALDDAAKNVTETNNSMKQNAKTRI